MMNLFAHFFARFFEVCSLAKLFDTKCLTKILAWLKGYNILSARWYAENDFTELKLFKRHTVSDSHHLADNFVSDFIWPAGLSWQLNYYT